MKKMIGFQIALAIITASASAGTLKIACGDNAYDAIESGKEQTAQFALVVELKGPNNPPSSWTLTKEGSVEGNISHGKISYQVTGDGAKSFSVWRVGLKDYEKYEFKNLKNCQDLNSATGDLTYSQYVGGLAGLMPKSFKCSCKQ